MVLVVGEAAGVVVVVVVVIVVIVVVVVVVVVEVVVVGLVAALTDELAVVHTYKYTKLHCILSNHYEML